MKTIKVTYNDLLDDNDNCVEAIGGNLSNGHIKDVCGKVLIRL